MRRNWTREELILAFNLYCKLPYGKFNDRSLEVKELANLLNRSPGAIAYKLVNFVSIDPRQKLLGRKGATHIGKLDQEIFNEFMSNFDDMFIESEKILNEKKEIIEVQDNILNIDETKKGEDKIRQTQVRKNQDYFRKIVLSNYCNRCAITGLAISELLIASHIKPWAKDKNNRLNPANGICLSATFDKAFDRGLITINQELNILFSSKLKKYAQEDFYQKELMRFENKSIILPIKFLPSLEFLNYHNQVVFIP